MISLQDLRAICPTTKLSLLELCVDPLNACMAAYEIDNVLRETMFISQVAHESGGFQYTEEIASGDAYEGRHDLGNTQAGDGRRFKGHGWIQCTGRANTQKYADYKGMSLDDTLVYLKTKEGAADVSGFFWKTHGLNELADKGFDYFVAITKRINGGTNGLADRQAYLARAQKVIV